MQPKEALAPAEMMILEEEENERARERKEVAKKVVKERERERERERGIGHMRDVWNGGSIFIPYQKTKKMSPKIVFFYF